MNTVLEQLLLPLDCEQRDAVMCDLNCVVSAGAGSGKTKVLAYRFLRLILEKKAHVDEILTLTFSRAAAAEMHERIHGMLVSYADDPFVRQELELFPEASISTIDSFCRRVVSTDVVRYGYASDFVLDDDADKLLAKECAVSFIEEHASHPGVSFLASRCHPGRFIEELWTDMAIACFHPGGSFSAENATELLTDFIEERIQTSLGYVLSAIGNITAMQGEGKAFAETLEICKTVSAVCEALRSGSKEYEATFTAIENIALSKRVSPKWEGAHEYKANVDVFHMKLARLRVAIRAANYLSHLPEIYDAIELFRQRYLERKRQNGILTFSDIAHMAIDVLKTNHAVRTYYKKTYKYIMIDEFQDNNDLQRQLLYLIAERLDQCSDSIPHVSALEPAKLFFVGDDKQSIYRFRGADVSVFKQLAESLESCGGRHIRLKHNYRSEPGLVEFYNTLFEQVMKNDGEPFEADFKALESRQATPFITPSVSFFIKPLEPDNDDESDQEELDQNVEQLSSVEAEAYLIASLIREMTEGDRYLIPNSDGNEHPRRPQYRDIAVLYRTSSNQLHYEKAFRAAAIPYEITAVQSLFLEPPANDLYAMLELLIFPDDKLAYVAALRSPFCRLSDGTILKVLEQYDKDSKPFAPLEKDIESDSYQAARVLFDMLKSSASRLSIAELIGLLWYDGGYRYHLLADPKRHVYLEHGEYLLELARNYDKHGYTLVEYLDFIRERLGQNEKIPDLEILREQSNGVRMMTIHASKGLQFPIVIVANTGARTRTAGTPCWTEYLSHIPVVYHMEPYKDRYYKRNIENIVYEDRRELLEAQETAEMKRLLYVGATRAQTHLVFTGSESKQNTGEQAYLKNMMMSIRHALGIESSEAAQVGIMKIDRIHDAPESVFRLSATHRQLLERKHALESYYHRHASPLVVSQRKTYGVTELVEEVDDYGEKDVEPLPSLPIDAYLVEHRLSAAFGTWCHAVISETIKQMDDQYSVVVQKTTDPMVCIPEEISDTQAVRKQEIARFASDLALRFFHSPVWQQLIEENPLRISTEESFAFRHIVEGKPALIYGTIDLVAEYEHTVRIVEFKTDVLRFAGKHTRQVAMYREALRQITDKPIESMVCYLRDISEVSWQCS